MFAPVSQVLGAAVASVQSDDLRPIVQPAEKTKAAFLARARALRDQAVREGDQAYGAVVVCDGTIVGEGRNYVVLHSPRTRSCSRFAMRLADSRGAIFIRCQSLDGRLRAGFRPSPSVAQLFRSAQ
jgi:hypothetical protein